MSDWIEGVGNEVLCALLVSAFLYVFIMLSVWRGFSIFVRLARDLVNIQFDEQDIEVDDALLRSFRDRRTGNDTREGGAPHFDSGVCPICLGAQQLPVETNCGHVFCGICIQSYYEHGGLWSAPLPCPLCRQSISMFFLCFTEAEMVDTSREVAGPRRSIVTLVRFYNARYSGEPRSFLSYFADWPTLMRHMWREFFTDGGLRRAFRLRVIMCSVMAILYLISPLDAVPEGVFGILGFIDDILLLIMLALYISVIYRRVVLERID